MGKEFTKIDKSIYLGTYAWAFFWFLVFIIGTTLSIYSGVSDENWMSFWKFYIYSNLIISVLTIIWFAIGGLKDINTMFNNLIIMKRDVNDNGRYVKK